MAKPRAKLSSRLPQNHSTYQGFLLGGSEKNSARLAAGFFFSTSESLENKNIEIAEAKIDWCFGAPCPFFFVFCFAPKFGNASFRT